MAAPLLSTKFHIPHARSGGVPRPRLTDALQAGVTHPGSFVLISGPAGFGKTTLLSGFAALPSRPPLAWLSLDEADNDPIRFWSYLLAACQSVQQEIGGSALALLQAPGPLPPETIPTLLINDLAGLQHDLVLVLDDYHVLHEPSIHAALAFLLEHLPDKFHPVISTRVDPPWPLARFRARGQLIEIRAADLRFTTQEAGVFLRQAMRLDLSAEDVAALEARTEGWIASLQLAALSMRGRSDVSGFIKAFTGSHVYVAEYLIEEILARQTDAVKTFLLKTSILESLNAGLCEAVSGHADGQSMLRDLVQSNLFVIPLDEEGRWFRYHHLFADLLQARLPQSLPVESIADLHRRAAAWYERSGMTPEAIRHLLAAKDHAQALRLIETAALPMILQAYIRTVEDWLQAIPSHHIEESPRANMAFAWLNLLRGSPAQASPYLERLSGMFASPEAGGQDPSLLGEWLAIQARLTGIQGRAAESRDLSKRALELLPEDASHVRSMVLVNLAAVHQQRMEYDQAAEIFQRIVREAQRTGSFAFEILGTSGQVQMLLQQGRLRSGFEIASEGVRRLEMVGKASPFSATLYGELGQIHYHWHQLEQARSYFQRSAQTSGAVGYSDPAIYHHIMLARMAQMEGDWEGAAQAMQQAGDLARSMPPVMVREHLISQQVRVELAFDRHAAARALLQAEGFGFEGGFQFPPLAPEAPVTEPLGLFYNSALRVVLHQSRAERSSADLAKAVALAGEVLAGELRSQHTPAAIETLLLRGQLRAALGETGEWADFAGALQLGEPEGFISIFVEEGPPVAQALAALLKRNPPWAPYIRQVLAAFPEPVHPRAAAVTAEEFPPIEPLTPRELEVLQLIAAGDSNQVIAGKLVITLSAVKKHAGSIFDKLNVSSRTQAARRARQLGLLSTND